MAITVADLKAYAAALACSESDETQLRSSMSRAYYAAFHAALPLAERLPESVGGRSMDHITHHELSARLSEWKVSGAEPRLARLRKTAGALASAMNSSRAARVKADYKLSVQVELAEAIAQGQRTKQILRILGQIETEMARPKAPVSA